MYNIIMQSLPWAERGRANFPVARMFEETDDDLGARFREPEGVPLLSDLMGMPCLFMVEGLEGAARVGIIGGLRVMDRHQVALEYAMDSSVPPIPNLFISEHRLDFDIRRDWEFQRNHWAVKDVDLYKALYQLLPAPRQKPTVFALAQHQHVEPDFLSVMMPFDRRFDPVFEAIRGAAAAANLRCQRADDVWETPQIMQDVVNLIDRSRIVVCDCTGRNANVFYEIGIAHTLGREVILIAQGGGDIPFDLMHLRHAQYLNNQEGLAALVEALKERITTVLGRE